MSANQQLVALRAHMPRTGRLAPRRAVPAAAARLIATRATPSAVRLLQLVPRLPSDCVRMPSKPPAVATDACPCRELPGPSGARAASYDSPATRHTETVRAHIAGLEDGPPAGGPVVAAAAAAVSCAHAAAGREGMRESQSKLSASAAPRELCARSVAAGSGCANRPSSRVTWSTAGDADCRTWGAGMGDSFTCGARGGTLVTAMCRHLGIGPFVK